MAASWSGLPWSPATAIGGLSAITSFYRLDQLQTTCMTNSRIIESSKRLLLAVFALLLEKK